MTELKILHYCDTKYQLPKFKPFLFGEVCQTLGKVPMKAKQWCWLSRVIVSVPTWVPGNTLSALQILSGKNKSQVASSVVAQFCNPSNQETSRPAWTCDLASKRSSQQQISTSTRRTRAQISWHLLYHEGQVLFPRRKSD